MNVIKNNSLILAIYIYIIPISLLFSPVSNSPLIKIFLLITLIVYSLFVNRGKMKLNFIFIFLILVVLCGINILMVPYQEYVFADGVNFLFFIIVPLYLVIINKLSIESFINYWYKIAFIATLLLPLFYLYYKLKYITYMDLGFITHLNIIILSYIGVSQKSKKITSVLLIINLVISLIYGSRMFLFASVIVIIISYAFFSKKGFKYYFFGFILTSIITYIFLNLEKIFLFLLTKADELGISSRNLVLFYDMVSRDSKEGIYLSGRDGIYELIIDYLNDTNAFFPSGLSVARYLTNGEYYHSHNFILEMILVLGYLGFGILLILIIYKIVQLYFFNNSKEETGRKNIIILLLISFVVRGLTGSYFILDSMFLLCICLILFFKKKTV